MKRLPRGGSKVNYTLYISPEEKKKIQARATELGMTESYYLIQLVELESELDLLPHVEMGGLLRLVAPIAEVSPEPSLTEKEMETFSSAISSNRSDGEISLPDQEKLEHLEVERAAQNPSQQLPTAKPTEIVDGVEMIRGRPIPRPTTISDLSQQAGMPGQSSIQHGTGQIFDKMHKELVNDEKSEKRLRDNVLNSLPPVKDGE